VNEADWKRRSLLLSGYRWKEEGKREKMRRKLDKEEKREGGRITNQPPISIILLGWTEERKGLAKMGTRFLQVLFLLLLRGGRLLYLFMAKVCIAYLLILHLGGGTK
jgi:hypothetical protein